MILQPPHLLITGTKQNDIHKTANTGLFHQYVWSQTIWNKVISEELQSTSLSSNVWRHLLSTGTRRVEDTLPIRWWAGDACLRSWGSWKHKNK